MVYLPQARFISSPLFVLAAALSPGIFAGHYVTLHATLVAILSGVLSIGLGCDGRVVLLNQCFLLLRLYALFN